VREQWVERSIRFVEVEVHTVNTAEALEHAIAAHAKWKWRLRDVINTGKSQWQVGDVRTDRACEFGQWLHALPMAQQLAGHYEKVRALHAEFHQVAADVLELALAGRKEEATAAMAFGSRFSAVSSNLTMAVSEWQTGAGRGPS
jgi:chemoreceptor zinc-binding protein